MVIDKGNRDVLRKPFIIAIDLTWTTLGMNPGLRGKKSMSP
jgi:hypothetical protein